MKDINILWFKKDLRIDDNEALYESLKNNDILPIYIFEIELWNQKTHSRRQWQFCKESVLDLRNSLKEKGQPLVIRTGNVIEIFEEISSKFNIMGIYSHQETGDWHTYKRDQEVKIWASNKKIKGLTLKNEKNRKILYFDKNKQKKYDLKSNHQFFQLILMVRKA